MAKVYGNTKKTGVWPKNRKVMKNQCQEYGNSKSIKVWPKMMAGGWPGQGGSVSV